MIKLNSIRKGLTQLKHVNISSILLSLLLLLLSACSVGDEEDKQKVEKDLKDLVEESSIALQKDEKETLAIDILEEKAMYTFEGKQGGEEFFVYFHAKNEVEEKLDSASYLGQAGDLMRSRDYSFYIAAKGDTIAYKQDQLDELSLTFNSEAEKNSPIYMDDYTIFSIFTHEASDALGHLLTTRLKAVDTDKLQTVSYNNEGEENDFG